MTYTPYYDDLYNRSNRTSYGRRICRHGLVSECKWCTEERLEALKKKQAESQEKGGTV